MKQITIRVEDQDQVDVIQDVLEDAETGRFTVRGKELGDKGSGIFGGLSMKEANDLAKFNIWLRSQPGGVTYTKPPTQITGGTRKQTAEEFYLEKERWNERYQELFEQYSQEVLAFDEDSIFSQHTVKINIPTFNIGLEGDVQAQQVKVDTEEEYDAIFKPVFEDAQKGLEQIAPRLKKAVQRIQGGWDIYLNKKSGITRAETEELYNYLKKKQDSSLNESRIIWKDFFG